MPMTFRVEEPERSLARMIEEGPKMVCHRGHPDCAFIVHGPCLEYPCTCETTGNCLSCRPVEVRR